ncbi:MAG TPA: CDP-archaeol synthase, partial [Pirellulaceae bacterium]|nr:CDP-archaeol synthase [Pirellulaceae bacterium]
MLRWRLISAAVILAVLLTFVWLDYRQAWGAPSGAFLLPVLLVVLALATGEVLDLLAAKGHRPKAAIVYLGNVAIPLAAALPVLFGLFGRKLPAAAFPLGEFGWPLVALAVATIAVLVGEMARFERPGTSIVSAALGLFTLVYVGLLGSFLALLRLFHDNDWGLAALFSVLLIVKMADVGAFAVGKNLGRTKLTPLLSPGKTWEGAIGGIATACLISWAFFHFAAPRIVTTGYVEPPLAASLAYGLILALAGMIGDLAESLLKRDMQRKDSSSW